MRNRTIWKDHVLSETGKFRVSNTSIAEDVKEITPYGTTMQQGTMQDANHFNNVEDSLDAHETAFNLLLNKERLDDWKHDEAEAAISATVAANKADADKKLSTLDSQVSELYYVQSATGNLTNSSKYPFNSSKTTIPLSKACENTNYLVHAEVVSCTGNVGEVVISEKLTNGFKAAYTGSAAKAIIKFTITGGWNK